MIRCPKCGYDDSKVTDSRGVHESIRRRRQCLECGYRFTTFEIIQNASLLITKKDRRREPFSREKLAIGIRKACEKRPLPTGILEKLVDDIEAELHSMGKLELPSSTIGQIVMRKLKDLDQIAYIRFASVYREFTDITTLKKEVDTLVALKPSATQLPLIPKD